MMIFVEIIFIGLGLYGYFAAKRTYFEIRKESRKYSLKHKLLMAEIGFVLLAIFLVVRRIILLLFFLF
jgi:hypothetical protein